MIAGRRVCCRRVRWRGLYGLHRLTTLESAAMPLRPGWPTAGPHGRCSLLAFAPMAFFFSAVYTESLYLALSSGSSVRPARTWAKWALLGALAAATRSAGVVLLLPALILYLYGPREDREPDRTRAARRWLRLRRRLATSGARCSRVCCAALPTAGRPLWLALVPLGLVLYMAHLALPAEMPSRRFTPRPSGTGTLPDPYGGVWDGVKAAFEGLRQLLSFQRGHIYFPVARGRPIHRRRPQPAAVRVPARRRSPPWSVCCVCCRSHTAAYVLGGARAAALLPGGATAADVAAPLPLGAVPAEHVACHTSRFAPAHHEACGA